MNRTKITGNTAFVFPHVSYVIIDVDVDVDVEELRAQANASMLRSAGCSPISKAGPRSSRWVSTNHTPLKSTWASRKGLCLALCCSRSQSTAAQSPTSSLTTAYSITNTPMTRSSISPCAPTTHLPGCPFSPSVPLMSNSGTCRTVYSSTRTSLKLRSLEPPISCVR